MRSLCTQSSLFNKFSHSAAQVSTFGDVSFQVDDNTAQHNVNDIMILYTHNFASHLFLIIAEFWTFF